MKNKLTSFLSTYRFCLLADILLIVGYHFASLIFGDKELIDTDMLSWNASGLYLLYVMPLYSILHGVLSCVFLNKIWLPNLILLLMIWLAIPIISNFRFHLLFSFGGLAFPLICFGLSAMGSLISAVIRRFVTKYKKALSD